MPRGMTDNEPTGLFRTNTLCLLNVGYEIHALAESAVLADEYDHRGDRRLRNACLEAALVHVRNLIEFTAGRPEKKSGKRRRHNRDIEPKDFVTEWDLPANLEMLDRYLADIDKYLSHLSKSRCVGLDSDDDALPPIRKLASDILDAVEPLANQISRQGGMLSERGGDPTNFNAEMLVTAVAKARSELAVDH